MSSKLAIGRPKNGRKCTKYTDLMDIHMFHFVLVLKHYAFLLNYIYVIWGMGSFDSCQDFSILLFFPCVFLIVYLYCCHFIDRSMQRLNFIQFKIFVYIIIRVWLDSHLAKIWIWIFGYIVFFTWNIVIIVFYRKWLEFSYWTIWFPDFIFHYFIDIRWFCDNKSVCIVCTIIKMRKLQ